MELQKAKSAAKVVKVKGPALSAVVLDTLGTISALVGATLGPGGSGVLIERYEHNLPPIITKDGVTCFRALGFQDPTKQVIMEAARDAAVRTASEAGDGTTTATVLAHAIVQGINRYCEDNKRVSSQRVVRALEECYKSTLEPLIKTNSLKVTPDEAGSAMLWNVAKISGNGDSLLADAVMQCFDITGDEGNVTIVEESGPSSYQVEEIKGYGVGVGYEDSCGKMWSKFINDPGTQRCVMEHPVFLVYHGKITEIQTIQLMMERIGLAWGQGFYKHHNVVIVAVGFSDSVLGQLAINFADKTTINVFPLTVPQSPSPGGQLGFLEDICVVTGATMFDPLNLPCDQGQFKDLGPGVEAFEVSRYRSNVVGHASGPIIVGYEDNEPVYLEGGTYEDALLIRIDDVKTQSRNAISQLDKLLLEERVAKLAGGIARLKVIGPSNGETKEKRDRVEDAVCAVRGALKHGCLPGGGWMLMRLSSQVEGDPMLAKVLAPALVEPIRRLLSNAGLNNEEAALIIAQMRRFAELGIVQVYNALSHEWYDCLSGAEGVLDSTPAVLEAVRNSISIATLLGTLGGTVCFARDAVFERSEAQDTANFLRNANVNEADERA